MIIERTYEEKVAFLAEYRELCHRHRMAIWADSEMGETHLDGRRTQEEIDDEVDSICL